MPIFIWGLLFKKGDIKVGHGSQLNALKLNIWTYADWVFKNIDCYTGVKMTYHFIAAVQNDGSPFFERTPIKIFIDQVMNSSV